MVNFDTFNSTESTINDYLIGFLLNSVYLLKIISRFKEKLYKQQKDFFQKNVQQLSDLSKMWLALLMHEDAILSQSHGSIGLSRDSHI